jgi:putative transposase
LKPTPAQAERLRAWVGTVRFVYNLCLEQRRDFWRQYQRQTGERLTWVNQSREIAAIRAEADWIADVPCAALHRAVRDLERAFQAFFAGRARYPTPRVKGHNDTFRLQWHSVVVRRLNAKWSALRLPKLGWVKFRDTRPLAGEVLSVTVALQGDRWSVSFHQAIPHDVSTGNFPEVGIDRGVAQTLTLSTGEHFQAPDTARLTSSRKRAQRKLARRRKGSARRSAQARKVRQLNARIARVRTDWCHRASADIASRFSLVAVENLNILNMTASAAGTIEAPGRNVRQKAGLNRSILEQCWGRFATFLDYKLQERGGMLISVPAAYTSQTCASCGVVDAKSRKSQAVFACVHCDHTDNADVNAAKEILRRSTALMGVEGSRQRPVEAPILAVA